MIQKEEQNIVNQVQTDKSIDFNRVLMVVMARWYIPVVTIVASLSIAYLQLRYTKPMYSAKLSMKFDDEKGGQVSDLFKYGRISGRIENILKTESEVMKSRTMALKTLKEMNMFFNAYIVGDIVSSRIYPNPYFTIQTIKIDSADLGKALYIQFNDDASIDILKEKGTKAGKRYLENDTISLGHSTFSISISDKRLIKAIDNEPIIIFINNLVYEAIGYSSGLTVEIEKNTNIVNIGFTSDVPELAKDYVNALAKSYIQETINNKAQAAEQTIKYIDDQLFDLSKKVTDAQKDLAGFKSANRGVSPDEISRIQFSRLINLEAQKSILQLRKKQLETLEKNIQNAKNKIVELIVFDAEDADALVTLFSLMNDLILERISMSSKNRINSPVMMENEKKISEVKSALTRAIQSIKQNLLNKIDDNVSQITSLSEVLSGLPTKEQALFNLERTFKINEKIYGYLQERRLENLISMSSITSNATIVDEALINYSPIFPKPGRNYALAILIGFGSGIGFIFLSRYLYNKIPDKETIESLSRTPVIGIIKKIDTEALESEYSIHVLKNPKSIFAESIRGIRTNINFILKGHKQKIICVTSSVSGEGKTFCTINLAASLTLLGNKVLIVGCDLRRPKIHLSFKDITNDIGLTTYLIDKHNLDEVIKTTEYKDLYVLPAGPTPPNPAELLQTEKFTLFLDKVKHEYDYVFFDTAPVGLVSDSFPLMAFADINLYILRAQYSKRDFALIPDRLSAENNVKSMFSILNSFDASAAVYSSIYRAEYGGYYGGGGYYYYGGYYGKGSYGYYGKKYYNNYYSGYYAEEEMNPASPLKKWLKKLIKRFKNKSS